MKKIFLAAIFTIAISAGLTVKTQAQTNAVNIENFSAANNKPAITQTPYFNNAGELMYVVKRYEAQGLPDYISKIMANRFSSFTVAGVEEIAMPSKSSVYVVHIENDKNLQTVKIHNDDVEVINKYKKG